ncbi:MAG TPA: VC0807 family protein [Opitutales bacterium]|nr:VC0807 family protein [Opitutales bacterium]
MEQIKTEPVSKPTAKRENLFLNIALNILVPVLLLKKGSTWLPFLTPVQVLLVALFFPVAYFSYDLYKRRKYNFISILGFVSILLTGGIGLLQLNPIWVAIKEAAIPALIGVGILLSNKTKYPLIRTFLYNKEIIEVEKIDEALDSRGVRNQFDRLLNVCTWLLVSSFLLSSVLNFFLARIIVTTNPADDAVLFNDELGSLTAWSIPVIVVPSMIVTSIALWKLLSGIKELTGLQLEEVFKQPVKD